MARTNKQNNNNIDKISLNLHISQFSSFDAVNNYRYCESNWQKI